MSRARMRSGGAGRRGEVAAFALLLLLALTSPVAAQDPGVARQRFTFLDHNLLIEVQTDAPGTLRILRGEAGLIDAAGSASPGFVSFGLAQRGRPRLSLTAVRAERVDYIVVVPPDVRVEVRLPGRRDTELLGSLRETATFKWEEPGRSEHDE